MIDDEVRRVATIVLKSCRAHRFTVGTAESCTGGLVAAALTEIAGSSDVFDRGFVTYSNEAKQDLLGVPKSILKAHGAVSRQTAEAMARGVLARTPVDLAVAITGIAGPGGGTPDKPVGLVHFAVAARDSRLAHHEARYGQLGRAKIRRAATLHALAMLRVMADG